MPIIKGFNLANEDKFHRVINGSIGREGQMDGTGVGENASDEVKLAAYDKLGGAIFKGKYKVKMGCFWNFKKKKAVEKPEVVLVLVALDGSFVEIPEGKEIPLEVKAMELHQEAQKEKKKRGRPKKQEDLQGLE